MRTVEMNFLSGPREESPLERHLSESWSPLKTQMADITQHNVFVGCETGILKGNCYIKSNDSLVYMSSITVMNSRWIARWKH